MARRDRLLQRRTTSEEETRRGSLPHGEGTVGVTRYGWSGPYFRPKGGLSVATRSRENPTRIT